jgi:hypothetical protein
VVNQIVIRYEVEKDGKKLKRKVTMSGAVRAMRPATGADKIGLISDAEKLGLTVEPEDAVSLEDTEGGPLLCYEINGQVFCW